MDNNNYNNNLTGNISMVICERIAYLRKRNKLSQEVLAKKLGITFQAVSKWENNQSCPDIAVIPEIARIFNVSVGYLFGETPLEDSGNEAINSNDMEAGSNVIKCNWENDDTLRVVVVKGLKLIKAEELGNDIKENVSVMLNEMSGKSISSQLNISIEGDIYSSTFMAGGNITCCDVGSDSNMTAGMDISCGDIDNVGGMTAGGDIKCGDINDVGGMTAGGNIKCGDISAVGGMEISGDLTSDGISDVATITVKRNITSCNDINAENISVGEDLNCGDINDAQKIKAEVISCGDISEAQTVTANTISCGDISEAQSVTATSISCGDISECEKVEAAAITCGDVNDCKLVKVTDNIEKAGDEW